MTDIQNCNLPQVSWVIPDGNWSDHAGSQNSPGDGGPSWVAAIVNGVGAATNCDNGGYWKDTVILVVWDDWGGFYDHVLPWRCQPGPNGACNGYGQGTNSGQYVYGFRVPMLVVSAWTPQGYVSGSPSQGGKVKPYIHDFGSILNFTEWALGTNQAPLSWPGSQNVGQGINPSYHAVVMDGSGNLYGTTTGGGNMGRCDAGCGTVYELSPTANGDWEEHILHRFGGVYDGAFPGVESLVVDKSGAVYGTTDVGGRRSYGTVFKVARKDGRWKETILHNFADDTGGSNPAGGVVMDKSGNLYGTTVGGGDPSCGGGVVYKLVPQRNGKWKYTVLHTFVGSDGAEPAANLVLDSKGNLYGTAQLGGSGHNGVAFELTP